MNTKQTILIYTILGIISLVLTYVTFTAAANATIYKNVLVVVSVVLLVMSIFFFVPVATGLVLLSKKN